MEAYCRHCQEFVEPETHFTVEDEVDACPMCSTEVRTIGEIYEEAAYRMEER